MHRSWSAVLVAMWGGECCAVFAAGIPAARIDEILVKAQRADLIGETQSASHGTVLGEQLEHRPVSRTGEVLETVPGLIVTQHSGDGKANQYFLRGFNLDHGTDFSTRVDGVPVNMPTHAHGQGYSDISFLIPELVDTVEYRKGTYYAQEGNFSAAGAADVRYRRSIDGTLVQLEGGEDRFRRALLATSGALKATDILFGLDYSTTDGPWQLEQDYRRVNALLKLTRGDRENGVALSAMGYDGRWRSTDQIPLRAVQSGALGRFGFVDPTNGGESHRYSLAAEAWRRGDETASHGSLFAIDYGLDLFSNFTYAIDPDGDQFEQLDDRRVFGGALEHSRPLAWRSVPGLLSVGLQLRHDDIDAIGLYRTVARERSGTVREDEVAQTAYAAYAAHQLRWRDWLRTELGARLDHHRFEVASDKPINSGTAEDTLVSPKLSMTIGPWRSTEYFINAGRGFHSNDARGTTIRVDPLDGISPVDPVDPLVPALGAELGARTAPLPGLQVAVALWTLELDSELLFIGDGGATEATRGSRRSGIELGVFYAPAAWLIIDADLALSRARFTDDDPAGERIPGALDRVASVGVAINHPRGWFGGARVRYFGDAPLIEDGSVRAPSTLLVNVEAGYRFSATLSATVALFNVFDRRANDITYFYESQLPSELEPVEDIHFHPVEPRTLRAQITARF